jgi:hypothetical protein
MIIETHWGEIDVGVFGVQLWPGDMDSYVQHCREENARERRQAVGMAGR